MPGSSNGSTLSVAEADCLAANERIIERGIMTFVEVGSALLSIKENTLYRHGHETFDDYCQGRWGMTGRRARQLIVSAEIDAEIGTTVPARPTAESQTRPLSALPAGERAPAWKEAVDASGGRTPTAKKVREVVAARIRGTRLNGELVEDPDDVHRDRLAGRIGPDIIVDVTEPEGMAPEPDEPVPPPVLSDDEWIAALPLHAELTGVPKRTFRGDALAYRHADAARKTYQAALSRLPKPRRRGPWRWAQDMALRKEPPDRWVCCPEGEHGGCGGTGATPLGNCPKCHGNGFLIP